MHCFLLVYVCMCVCVCATVVFERVLGQMTAAISMPLKGIDIFYSLGAVNFLPYNMNSTRKQPRVAVLESHIHRDEIERENKIMKTRVTTYFKTQTLKTQTQHKTRI
jgi:hypothetical protein